MKTKNKEAVTLGRLGGIASSKALNKEERKERAKLAANARWSKVSDKNCQKSQNTNQ